jgi:hypothetical protein
MRTLLLFGELLTKYPDTATLQDEIAQDAEDIRQALLHAVHRHHPARPRDVTADEYTACITFLNNFHRLFTLNYDLLLYWAICEMVHRGGCRFDDGFRKYEEDLLWKKDATTQQNVFYLHGALHLIESGPTLRKLGYADGEPIIDQLRSVLESKKAPLFVSDGMGEAKLALINDSAYLRACYRALERNESPLVVFGASLGESDEHISDAIVESNAPACYVGFHDTDTPAQRGALTHRFNTMAQARERRRRSDAHAPALLVRYYSTTDAHVWR